MPTKKLEFRSESRDAETRIYSLSGNLFGSAEGYRFQEEVRQEIAAGVKKVVIDLGSVGRIDSSGVGILVATMWSASHAGAGLLLASVPPKVEKVLSIVLLLDHIGHADTVEHALEELDRMKLEAPRS